MFDILIAFDPVEDVQVNGIHVCGHLFAAIYLLDLGETWECALASLLEVEPVLRCDVRG